MKFHLRPLVLLLFRKNGHPEEGLLRTGVSNRGASLSFLSKYQARPWMFQDHQTESKISQNPSHRRPSSRTKINYQLPLVFYQLYSYGHFWGWRFLQWLISSHCTNRHHWQWEFLPLFSLELDPAWLHSYSYHLAWRSLSNLDTDFFCRKSWLDTGLQDREHLHSSAGDHRRLSPCLALRHTQHYSWTRTPRSSSHRQLNVRYVS